MKVYDFVGAPNPKKLRVYLAEKGLKVPTGERPTIADCTLFAALEFGDFVQIALDPSLTNVSRWYAAFKQRPSAQA